MMTTNRAQRDMQVAPPIRQERRGERKRKKDQDKGGTSVVGIKRQWEGGQAAGRAVGEEGGRNGKRSAQV